MIRKWCHASSVALFVIIGFFGSGNCHAAEGWIELIGPAGLGPAGLEAWQTPTGAWFVAGGARVDPKTNRQLVGEPGTGVIINGKTGKTSNLISREEFGDVEAHFEFMIPKGSNSGVKFHQVYEIQIYDSFGKTKLSGSDCGGIYPRAEMLPVYHHIDEGTAPRLNACLPFGEWQALDVVFRAPRFDSGGMKVKDARFEKVVLNGRLIHENAVVKTPTGHYWHQAEHAKGAIFLQADHGPVAFRKIRVRAID
jgi:hypothetical protein